jgi:hypothetical protein
MEEAPREKITNKKRFLVIIAIVIVAVLLSILFGTMLVNHQPVITSLKAEADWTTPSSSLLVTCNASDRDGDELSYNWSASGSVIQGEGDTVNWIAPYYPLGSYDITVMVTDSRGGEAMSQVTITVRADRPPIITSLVADADWTLPSDSIQVTCTASDPDGDELTYEWTATGGDISGTGAVVNWTAPQEAGIYDVTVVIKDGHSEEDTRSITLSMALGTPPIIEDIVVTAKGHKYLKKSTSGHDYDVWKEKEYDIECVVSDTGGGVSYTWSCDDGEISGEGSMITWTAPSTSGKVPVTVIVSDIAGNSVGRSIDFYVPFCACGF